MKPLRTKGTCFICGKDIVQSNLGARYLRCSGCGLVITDYIDASISATLYPAEYYGRDGIKFTGFFKTIRDCLLGYRKHAAKKITSASCSILDIGCGNGKFLSDMSRFCFHICGVELPGPAFEAERRIPGITLVPADELSPASFDKGSFSVITLWHSLEHISNPADILLYCGRWLRKDGFVLIEAPNIQSCQAQLFGNKWLHMDYPRHRFHFTPHALRLLLEKAGFTVIDEGSLSLDMGIFGIIQSALNLFIKPDNYLYSCMHRKPSGVFALKEIYSIFWAIILLPFALIFTVLESVLRSGSVIRYVCRMRCLTERKEYGILHSWRTEEHAS